MINTLNGALPAGISKVNAAGSGSIFKINGTDWLSAPGGTIWTTYENYTYQFRALAFGNDVFVAVTDNGIYRSADGVTWTLSDANNQMTSIAFGNGVFVAIQATTGTNPGLILYSTNGINWNGMQSGSNTAAQMRQIVFGNGQFVINTSGVQSARLLSSTTGMSFTSYNVPIFTSTNQQKIAFANGWFTMTDGLNTVGIFRSQDAVNWTNSSPTNLTAGSSRMWNMAYGNGTYVASLLDTSTPHYSQDLINWTPINSTYQRWDGLIFASQVFIMVNAGTGIPSNQRLRRSLDGITFTTPIHTNPTGKLLNDVKYGNGRFVVVGNGIVLVSTQ